MGLFVGGRSFSSDKKELGKSLSRANPLLSSRPERASCVPCAFYRDSPAFSSAPQLGASGCVVEGPRHNQIAIPGTNLHSDFKLFSVVPALRHPSSRSSRAVVAAADRGGRIFPPIAES